MLETLVCYYVAFYYPQYVTQNTPGHYFFCSAASIILVGLLTSILLMLLNRLYEKENELSRRQKKEIEELNKAENNFFSSMSHEIRTPINTIIGLNEFILRGDIPEDVAENARNIQNASKMLLTLINDILDLSKIKSKKNGNRQQVLCDALLLHPIILLRNSRMVVGGMGMGSFAHVAKAYIRKVLTNTGNIDRRILFITYAGMEAESVRYILDVVQQYCPFERVYIQKASAAVASNCGPGSFGLLFMKKMTR